MKINRDDSPAVQRLKLLYLIPIAVLVGVPIELLLAMCVSLYNSGHAIGCAFLFLISLRDKINP